MKIVVFLTLLTLSACATPTRSAQNTRNDENPSLYTVGSVNGIAIKVGIGEIKE